MIKKLLIFLAALATTVATAQNVVTYPRLAATTEFRVPTKASCSTLTNQRKGDLCYDSNFDNDGDGTGEGQLQVYNGAIWERVGRIATGSPVPGSCSDGDVFVDTDNDTIFACISGAYTSVGGGGSGGSGDVVGPGTTTAVGDIVLFDNLTGTSIKRAATNSPTVNTVGHAEFLVINNVYFADMYGGQADDQIQNCVAAAASVGGICDARGLTGAQPLTGTIDILGTENNVTLLLGEATFTPPEDQIALKIIQSETGNVQVIGLGNQTHFDCSTGNPANEGCVYVVWGSSLGGPFGTLKGFQITGDRDTGDGAGAGLRFTGKATKILDSWLVEDVTITKVVGNGIAADYVSNLRIRNVNISETDANGIILGPNYVDGAIVQDSYFYEAPVADSSLNYASIKASGASETTTGGDDVKGIWIIDNHIVKTGDVGIACEGINSDGDVVDGCHISRNKIDGTAITGDGGECIATGPGNNFVISDNTIDGCGATGILLYGQMTGFTVSGNVVDNVSICGTDPTCSAEAHGHSAIQVYPNTITSLLAGTIQNGSITGNTGASTTTPRCDGNFGEPCTSNTVDIQNVAFCGAEDWKHIPCPVIGSAPNTYCDTAAGGGSSVGGACVATTVTNLVVQGNDGTATNRGRGVVEAGRCDHNAAVTCTDVVVDPLPCGANNCVFVGTVEFASSFNSLDEDTLWGSQTHFLGARRAQDITVYFDEAGETPPYLLWDESADGFAISNPLVISADEAETTATVGLVIDTDADESSNFTALEVRDDADGPYAAATDLLSSIDYTGEVYARGGFQAEASATPTLTLRDSDNGGYVAGSSETTAEAAFKLVANLTTVTDAAEVSDATFSTMIDGSETTFMLMDSDAVDTGTSSGAQLELGNTAIAVNIPSGAAPPTNYPDPAVAGQIAIDTSGDQLVYFGTAKAVLSPLNEMCVVLEDPVDADDDIPFYFPHKAVTITDVYCLADGTTPSVVLTISDGSDALEAITCTDSGASDDGSIAYGTFNALERMEFDLSTLSGTITWLTFCVTYTLDAE